LTVNVNGLKLKLMPKTVNSKQLTVNRQNKTVHRLLSTVYHKGFTLIELLIVISIIGILASLTLASYNGAQQKARDGVRKQDLAQVKRALELAKSDCRSGAFYPYKADYGTLSTFLAQGSAANSYMNPVPVDPKNTGSNVYSYYAVTNSDATTCPADTPAGATGNAGSTDYTLKAVLERVADGDGSASWTRCLGKPYASGGTVTGAYTAGSGVYLVCNN
jgi:prepilin-type N-terminal cleavage/methylation domain-containing protein